MPTLCDIYLELNGKKIAVVQSYRAKPCSAGYDIELTRLYATNESIQNGLNFYELEDFNLVICKPDRKIIYSGCQWRSIEETGTLRAMEVDRMVVTAKERREKAAHD